jgi:hypothetical protein
LPAGAAGSTSLIADPTANAASIATRDDCSIRKVNMTISLAFLAPDLVKAAIEGRLPHGMGVVRLADLAAEAQVEMTTRSLDKMTDEDFFRAHPLGCPTGKLSKVSR